MALKGTTKIELTDVRTGKTETIEKHNIVTRAVESALSNPYASLLKQSYSSYYYAGNILPLCPNLFGGILLYEDAIPESVNQLYAQASNKLVGYASNNVNSLTDTMRGSLNQTESGALEDGSGYRFVFDFTTSQGNGTISAVGLTSKWGGISGYGSLDYKNTQSPVVYAQESTGSDRATAYAMMSLMHYDDANNVATAVYVLSQSVIAVSRFRLHVKNWKLASTMMLDDPMQLIETQTIETEVFAGATVSGANRYHNFCDGGDGYIWGFEHAANALGNSAGKATINWIKIKIDDLTFEEGTWEIDAQIFYMGSYHVDPEISVRGFSDVSNSAVLDGYLYCIKYDKTGLYKIKLSNVTDITFIEHPNKAVPFKSYGEAAAGNYRYCYAVANLTVAGNKVCLWDCWLNKDTFVQNQFAKADYYSNIEMDLSDGWRDTGVLAPYPFRHMAGAHGVEVGVFRIQYAGFLWYYSTNQYQKFANYMLLNSPYLATINNLPTPVQKTADKTMKITYILREES